MAWTTRPPRTPASPSSGPGEPAAPSTTTPLFREVGGCSGEAGQGLISGRLSAGCHPGTPSGPVSAGVSLTRHRWPATPASSAVAWMSPWCSRPRGRAPARCRLSVLGSEAAAAQTAWALHPTTCSPPRGLHTGPCPAPLHCDNHAPSRRFVHVLCTWFSLRFLNLGAYPFYRVWEGGSQLLSSPFLSSLSRPTTLVCQAVSFAPARRPSLCLGGLCFCFLWLSFPCCLQAHTPFPGHVLRGVSSSRVSR